MAMVATDAFHGAQKKNPFKFMPFDLKSLVISSGGYDYPAVPYDLSFRESKQKFARAYADMLDGTGFLFSSSSNNITPDMFRNGWTVFVIDLSSSKEAATNGAFDLVRYSPTDCRLRFEEPIPAGGVNLVFVGEFDSILMVDKNRLVSTDLSV